MRRKRHPLSFEDEAARLHVTSYGIPDAFPIEVERIVGSAGKAESLDASFRPPRFGTPRTKLQSLEYALRAGETVPPISVYELGGRYFVIDGHKRVAAARAVGVEYLDARVIPARPGHIDLTHSGELALERVPTPREFALSLRT